MSCLVVGGNGFIGRHLVKQLTKIGHHVIIFDRVAQSGKADHRVEYHLGTFDDQSAIRKAVRGCEVVFHLAWTTYPKVSNDNPFYDAQSNILGTIQLLNVCIEFGVQKIVFLSSGGTVYGIPYKLPIPEDHPTNPICSYGISKLTIEKYLDLYYRLHGLDYVILRPSNAYGEGQSPKRGQGAIAAFLWCVANNQPIEVWGDGSVIRDYVHVDDIIRALLMVSNEKLQDRVLNLGSGIGTSLKDIIQHIQELTKRKVEVHYTASRSFDVPAVVLNIQRIQKQIGWSPQVKLADGLLRTWEWLKNLSIVQ